MPLDVWAEHSPGTLSRFDVVRESCEHTSVSTCVPHCLLLVRFGGPTLWHAHTCKIPKLKVKWSGVLLGELYMCVQLWILTVCVGGGGGGHLWGYINCEVC